MKIFLTCHQFFPRCYHGTERYTLDLAQSLVTLGHQVVVLTTSRNPEDSRGTPWYDYVFEGISVIAVDLAYSTVENFSSSFSRPDLTGIFDEVLCRERPDVIHCCHLLYLGTDFLSVAANAQVPIFMTLTDFFGICWTNRLQTCRGVVCGGPDPDDLNCVQDVLQTIRRPLRFRQFNGLFRRMTKYRWFIQQIRWLARNQTLLPFSLRDTVVGIDKRRHCISKNYDHVVRFIAATDYLKFAYENSGYSTKSIEVLRFGICQPTPAEQEILSGRYESLRESNRPIVIGFIGQVSAHKGIHVLLQAFAISAIENCQLLIYGDVDQSADTAKSVHEYIQNDSRIRLGGTFKGSEIYGILSGIDVLVMPSTWAENSPLVLLNALASRTMVVVSNVNGMAEMVNEGVTGRLVRAGDPADLSSTLSELVLQRNSLQSWSEGVTKPYTTSPLDYATKILQLYNLEIVASNRLRVDSGESELDVFEDSLSIY